MPETKVSLRAMPSGYGSRKPARGRQFPMPYLWSLHVQRFIRGAEVHQGRGRQVPRHPIHGSSWCAAALQHSGLDRRRGVLHRRPAVRRLLDPRLREHPRVGHAAHPGRVDGVPRPVPRGEDAHHGLRHLQPAHRRDLLEGPASGRQEGREVPRLDRHRRHRVLRPRGRVLHLRRRPLRGEAELELLLRRLRGGRVEHAAATKRAATSPTRPPTRAATSPSARSTSRPTCATTSASS